MAFTLFILGWIFVLGLIIGSFLNVVILRTVSGESIVFPASKCPKCQTPLKWYHNIPVFSYLFLRGKCAFCKEHISIQYPIVELLTGVLFLALFLKICKPIDPLFGLSTMMPIGWFQILVYIFALIVTGLFISIAGTDFIEKKVADAHTIPLILMGLVFSFLYTCTTFWIYYKELGELPKISLEFVLTSPLSFSIIAGVVGFVVMELLARVGIPLVGTRVFGEGDSYIAAGLGTVFGGLLSTVKLSHNPLPAVCIILLILALSCIIQLVITLPMFMYKLAKQRNWMTFGSICAFIIYTAGYLFAQHLKWLDNSVAYCASTIVLVAIGIFVCREILLGLKNKDSEGLYLPFGPAMVIAGLLTFFMLNI